VTLGGLLHALAERTGVPVPAVGPPASELPVSGIAYDSRQARAGSVFVAIKGIQADGTRFVRDAISRGAIAAVSEASAPPDARVVWVEVPDARLALAALAAIFHEDPSERLRLVGITGTNGKTTVSYLLTAIVEAAGVACGRVGTVGYRIGRRDVESARTTPESPDLQAMLRDMVAQGCGACVMEVSSHALVLKRADYLRFAAGVFTNLTRDHLDFHRNMEDYYAAKRRLFELLPEGAVAVINLDDRRGTDLLTIGARHMSYGIEADADVRPASDVASSFDGLAFTAGTPRGPVRVQSPLVGRANVYNILAAVAAATALELPIAAIEQGVASLGMVPGRFQVVSHRGRRARGRRLRAYRRRAEEPARDGAAAVAGRVITVFGCGGDRDPAKRPLMGAVAARLSDLVIVTSDNPRSEDPGADHRADPPRHRTARRWARTVPGRRARAPVPRHRRPQGRDRASRVDGGAGRPGPHRGQGSREVPGDRRSRDAVRRRGRGAGGARPAPVRAAGVLTGGRGFP
jgi:UDP-N-acetylmuramoyl-L-alanyl-D-glutamate--2,6-diaminopimelate ligase